MDLAMELAELEEVLDEEEGFSAGLVMWMHIIYTMSTQCTFSSHLLHIPDTFKTLQGGLASPPVSLRTRGTYRMDRI